MTPDDPLPPGWCWTTLEVIADIEGGITKDQKRKIAGEAREVPYLRVANVQRGHLDLSDVRTIPATPAEVEALRLKPGDVLFTEGGDRDKLGRGWVWNSELPECIHQNHIFRARPDQAVILPKFLSHHGNHFGQDWFTRTGKQTTNLASISKKALRAFPVPLPPLAEQRRIVAKVEELFAELDEGAAALRRVQAKLRRYRAAVLRAAVDGSLTADWRAAHPAAEPAAVLVAGIRADRRRRWEDAQRAKFAAAGKEPKGWQAKYADPAAPDPACLPRLPDGWCWASALQVCDRVENGNTPPPDKMTQGTGEVPFIKVYNLTHTGRLDFTVKPTFVSADTHRNMLGRSVVLPGDVLMNIVGPPLGKVSLVPDDYPEWNTNQAVVLFRPLPGLSSLFLHYCLMAEPVMRWITSQAKATAGQHNISVSMSRALPIPLPPPAEQAAIVAEVERRLTVADAVAAQVAANLRRAGRLRQGVLTRAFAGTLVPQDPADEPAAALLARLRTRTPPTAVRKRRGGTA